LGSNQGEGKLIKKKLYFAVNDNSWHIILTPRLHNNQKKRQA